MRNASGAIVLAVQLLFISACGQSADAKEDMEAKQTYSLCPTSEDSRQRLYDQAKSFTDQQGASLIDRSAGAKRELSHIGSDVLNNTGGSPILLTIEKPDRFRVSITNLGLREKVALTVRWGAETSDAPVSDFMVDLARFLEIEEVERSVENDPPCKRPSSRH
jgi:hypothetical protein